MNDPNRPQNPSPFSSPIASPDGYIAPSSKNATPTTVVRGDYKTAPQIVKSARLLAIITVILGAIFLALAFTVGLDGSSPTWRLLLLGAFMFGMGGWLTFGHSQGQSAAWIGQIVLSALGVTGFPLGTLIHGYLLAKWFSPEVKAWYGRD